MGLFLNMSSEMMRNVFIEIDVNGDRSISLQEWLDYIKETRDCIKKFDEEVLPAADWNGKSSKTT